MDSIDRNQPEDNYEDLQGQEAVTKIKEMVEQAENCFFCSAVARGESNGDRDKIKELWSPVIQTWFTEGMDDPRITVTRVTATEGYYWDTKHGTAVAGVKMLIGAVLRKTLDDSIQGKLDV